MTDRKPRPPWNQSNHHMRNETDQCIPRARSRQVLPGSHPPSRSTPSGKNHREPTMQRPGREQRGSEGKGRGPTKQQRGSGRGKGLAGRPFLVRKPPLTPKPNAATLATPVGAEIRQTTETATDASTPALVSMSYNLGGPCVTPERFGMFLVNVMNQPGEHPKFIGLQEWKTTADISEYHHAVNTASRGFYRLLAAEKPCTHNGLILFFLGQK